MARRDAVRVGTRDRHVTVRPRIRPRGRIFSIARPRLPDLGRNLAPVLAPIPRPLTSPPSSLPRPQSGIPSFARHLPQSSFGAVDAPVGSAHAPHVVYNWPITGEKHIPVDRYIATTSTSWPFFYSSPQNSLPPFPPPFSFPTEPPSPY